MQQPAIGEHLDAMAITRHLRRLAAAYPAFTFSHELVNPRNGKRWVARRKNGADPGIWIVITRDLMELHAALAAYKGDCLAR